MPSHYKGTAGEVLALNTYIKLMRAGDSLGGRILRRGTLGGLTISQFAALEALYYLGPLRQNEIGARTLRSPGNMTLVLDNLEKAGLLSRTRAPDDRRAVIVSLTPKGRRRVAGVLPGHIAAIVDEMSALSADEQRALGDLCKKLGKRRDDEHER
jgi:MarR family 2-MHQ and catechol resistance regulon transcriptional repressor